MLRSEAREEEKSGEEERPVQPDQPVLKQANYYDQDRLAFVMSSWQMAEDTRSMPETSDSGVPGTYGAPSEIGMEETFGKVIVFVTAWNLFCLVLSTKGAWFSEILQQKNFRLPARDKQRKL